MPNKKNFKNNPAMTFINTAQENAQQDAQERTQDDTQQTTHDAAQDHTHEVAQDDTQQFLSNIRTQGRKGHKKPRINLAFDSTEFLDKIRICAYKDGLSITQFVNEAVAYYLKHTKGER